jgi:hypothetical protein
MISLDQHISTQIIDDIIRLLDIHQESDENKYGEVSGKLKAYYYTFEFNSPYAEVRASVPNTDDPSLPVETFRAWFLGIFFGSVFGAANQVRDLHCPVNINTVLLTSVSFHLRWLSCCAID